MLEVTEEDFEHLFRINVFGMNNCYSEAARQMIDQGSCRPDRPGKLIGAASVASFRPCPLLTHYSASKYAVRGLTHSYALELAPQHITANSYAPGIVGTKMWEEIDARIAERTGKRRGEVIKQWVNDMTALGRVSVESDVAKLVSFLASSDSDYVTGQTQVVDGGMCYT